MGLDITFLIGHLCVVRWVWHRLDVVGHFDPQLEPLRYVLGAQFGGRVRVTARKTFPRLGDQLDSYLCFGGGILFFRGPFFDLVSRRLCVILLLPLATVPVLVCLPWARCVVLDAGFFVPDCRRFLRAHTPSDCRGSSRGFYEIINAGRHQHDTARVQHACPGILR